MCRIGIVYCETSNPEKVIIEKLAKLALCIPNSCHPAFGLWKQMSRLISILIVMTLSAATLNHAEELDEAEFCNGVGKGSGKIIFVTPIMSPAVTLIHIAVWLGYSGLES